MHPANRLDAPLVGLLEHAHRPPSFGLCELPELVQKFAVLPLELLVLPLVFAARFALIACVDQLDFHEAIGPREVDARHEVGVRLSTSRFRVLQHVKQRLPQRRQQTHPRIAVCDGTHRQQVVVGVRFAVITYVQQCIPAVLAEYAALLNVEHMDADGAAYCVEAEPTAQLQQKQQLRLHVGPLRPARFPVLQLLGDKQTALHADGGAERAVQVFVAAVVSAGDERLLVSAP